MERTSRTHRDGPRRPTRRGRALLAAALLLLAAPSALAQDEAGGGDAAGPAAPAPEDEKLITFTSPRDGFTLLDLLEAVNKQTNNSVLYDTNAKAKIEKTKVQFVGTYTLPRSRMFDWLQGVLSFESFILIPIGPTGHEQWMVVDITNQAIRSRPTYVREEELEQWKDRDGVYIVSTLRVKNLDQQDAQRARTAIQQLATTTASIGRINEIPGQNAFVIADFAPVVYAAKQLLVAMDVPIEANKPTLVKVQIQYALASDMEGMLNDLLSGVTPQGQPRPRPNQQAGQVKPDPVIRADNRTNSLIIYAVPEDIDKIKVLIAELDTEFRGKSRLRFRTLKYQGAVDVRDLLQDLIAGAASVGRTSSSSRSSSRSRTTSPTAAQPQGTPFGVSGEGEPVIIADETNNSLIIHATEDQYADLDDLIDKIDRPRRQVLIETALLELTMGSQLDFGLDAFSVENNVAVDTNGDGIVDTFTSERSLFGLSFFNNSSIVTEEVNGVEVPIANSPNITRGFTAGIFNNGRIPVILHALQTRTPAKILTMPSIVTSDNQSANISTTDTVPFLTTTFVGPNQTPTQSFEEVEAVTSLEISPSISAEDFLRLDITQQVSSFRSAAPGQRPPTTSRQIHTQLMVPNASTVVLGGIISTQETETIDGIPILMDIPIVGFLFRNTSTSLSKTNLFLFVTPTILKDLQSFSDYHAISWQKKVLQDRLFGEEVELLGTNFLGPNVPRSAGDAIGRIQESGILDAYRYKGEPSEAERIEATRRAFEEAERERKAAGNGSEPPPAPAGNGEEDGADGGDEPPPETPR